MKVLLTTLGVLAFYAPAAGAAPEDCRRPMTTPLALTVRVEGARPNGDVPVVVTLRNCSAEPVAVVFDEQLQPPAPVLRDAHGRAVRVVDRRAAAKFDRTAYLESFTTLSPGGELIQHGLFEWVDDAWEGRLGPYRVPELEGTHYQLSVKWQSQLTRGVDEDTGHEKAVPHAWVGHLVAPAVALELPKR